MFGLFLELFLGFWRSEGKSQDALTGGCVEPFGRVDHDDILSLGVDDSREHASNIDYIKELVLMEG